MTFWRPLGLVLSVPAVLALAMASPPALAAGTIAIGSSFITTQVPGCGGTATLIHDVQGNGAASPIAGATVTVEGIVTVGVPGTGYFLQEEVGEFDADPLTSEGILVFSPSALPVAVGDLVRITGVVAEFQPPGADEPRTQLAAPITAERCSAGIPVLSTDVPLPVVSFDPWEPYEGMLISVDEPLTVTGTSGLGPAEELDLAVGGRLAEPTSTVEPGAPAGALQDLNDRSRILTRYAWRAGGLSASNTLRVGDLLAGPLIGALDQRPVGYRVEPVDPAALVFDHANPRPMAPEGVGGILRVASMDLGGYFTTLDSGGANTPQELVRQRDKLVAGIAALGADVVGVTGLENDSGAAVADLIAALDASAPGSWAAVETGSIGTDATKVAIIVRVAVVAPVGAHAVLDSSTDARFDDTENRPSLAQAFNRVGGARLTVAVNDFAARDADCEGDGDAGDGQGACNASRTAAAEALVDWIATDPTASGDPDVIVLGNLNAHRNEDPVDVLRAAGYVDLVPGSYSSVFAGQSGAVDHAFASASVGAQVTGSTAWHINADEPALLDYNTESKSADELITLYAPTPYRSASRDPLLVGVNLAGERPVAGDDTATTAEDSSVIIAAAANDGDLNGDLDLASITVVTAPSAGTVTVNADGTVTYVPAPNFHGTDSFGYQICDTTDLCDQATVIVSVNTVGDAPITIAVSAATNEDEAVVIDVSLETSDVDGDLDTDSVVIVRTPAHGTAVVGSPITYTPAPNFSGTDSFEFEICDTTDLCDRATVTVTVRAVNDPPVAESDVASVSSRGRISIDVLANDTDVDGRSDIEGGTLTIVTGPSLGTAAVAGGVISYTAPAGGEGTARLTYRICDPGGLCATAAVEIRVEGGLPPTGTLPATGSPVTALLAAAWLALGLGGGLLVVGRRRRPLLP